MTRRRRLIGQVALVGALCALAFPGESSAFSGVLITLTAHGPSPANPTIAVDEYPIWFNNDTAAHTVTFADGCTFDVAAGKGNTKDCSHSWRGIGNHAYTVDGTIEASLNVVAEWRRVTLRVKHHGFAPGSRIRLHGILAVGSSFGPITSGARQPVRVFARRDRHHPWDRIAIVMARPFTKPQYPNPHSAWHLWVHPSAHMTYRAVATSKPKIWEKARSRPFGVYVRR